MNSEEIESISLLCDELLLLILQYVGKDRKSIRLTCKRFDKIICEIEKNKIPLKINNELVRRPLVLTN